ncbi:SurA N-terminal domain-containing protein [Adlercreutzia murintestinalis]|uniref:SurA N-terminal domain-containing protein n=1 Tax=Adlercreutzia murintestinalis TaxID=2941325 RepID=UPI002040445C|nr:SurA N-terminal domain-containing protein [Adlercreutzia murintestinalis]
MKKTKFVVCATLAASLSLFALSGCQQQETQIEAPSDTVRAVYDVYDTSEGVAATVNGVELGEKAVTAYVDSRREAFGMTDDESWKSYLEQSQITPEELRNQIIDQYVSNEEIRQAAAANGIEVTDEEVDKAVADLKEQYGNESSWRIYLKQTGQTEYDVRESQRISLLNRKLYYLATGSSELEDLVNQITSQMLSSAATSDELTALQEEQQALPEDASQEQKDELQAKIDAAQTEAQDNLKSAQELVDLIDAGIAKMKEAMGAEIYEATDEEVLAFIQQTDESLAQLDSLEGIPATIVSYVRSQITSENKTKAYQEFMADYLDGATVVVNDAPAGLTYFIEVSLPAADDAAADDAAAEGDAAEGDAGALDETDEAVSAE